MSRRFVALFALVFAFVDVVWSAPAEGLLTYSGVAKARRTGDFLYGERHVLSFRDGRLARRVVLYTCRDGSAFARKTVAYVDPLAPDFLVEDASNGMREGVRTAASSAASPPPRAALSAGVADRLVFFRENARSQEKTGPLPQAPGLVADAGFDEFVQAHWPKLMSGEVLEMRFLVPSRLADYGFQVQRLRSETVLGVAAEVFRLRLSGFWGWLLPGIDVHYSEADHLLVRYDGLSDLRDGAGNNFKTIIEFPPKDRHPATADSLQQALQAPIAACR
jgi:hypothetical protein